MKPAPAPEVDGNTPWQRLDSAVRQVFTVPKEAVIAEELRRKRAKARKKAKTKP